MLIAVPVGIGTGIYLSEYGSNRVGAVIRFLADVLTGTPSIVLGYFSYIVFVTSLGWGFSLSPPPLPWPSGSSLSRPHHRNGSAPGPGFHA